MLLIYYYLKLIIKIKVEIKGSIILVMCLIFLQGICGMSYGKILFIKLKLFIL